jgi:hypothetical protein
MDMRSILPLGIVAGLATTLLLAAIKTGSAIAIPLFLVAPLPIALAGLLWGSYAAAVAAASASVAWAIVSGPQSGFAVFLLTAAPMAWITYLLGLSRQAGAKRQWYPIGRILLHAAAIIAGGLILIGLFSGFDPIEAGEEAAAALRSSLAGGQLAIMTEEQIDSMTRLYVAALPYAAAAGSLAVIVFNGWLGVVLLESAGRLNRTRDPLWTAELPRSAAYILVAAIAGIMLPGLAGAAAAAIAGALGLAYALVGLAVIHAVTLGRDSRGLVLFITYASILLLGVTLVIAAIIGLIDSFYRLRSTPTPPLSS